VKTQKTLGPISVKEVPHENSRKTIGLIAGAGCLPTEAARLLAKRGFSVRVVGFSGLTDHDLQDNVDQASFLPLGQLEAMARALNEMDVRELLMLGKVPKSLLFDGRGIVDPDEEALRLLSQLPALGDENLMRSISRWLEGRGFSICDQGKELAPLLAPVGALSARVPSDSEYADFEFGRTVVSALGLAGIGQCVVVKQGSVLAVEAIEGTDATIRRAGEVGGAGSTVIKAARPTQDRRFDLPAIGVSTIDAMIVAGASALAIEAGSTLMIDRKAIARAADKANLSVWGFMHDSAQDDRPS
jgi:DUF1009 family protein